MLYVLVGSLAIGFNGISLIVIAFHKPLRKRLPNYFVINQCVLDLLMGLSLLITMTLEMNIVVGPSPLLYCYVIQSRLIFVSAFLASIWNLAAMAFERYMEIVHPIRHKLWLSRRKIIVGLVSTWVIGFGFKTWLVAGPQPYAGGTCILGRNFTGAIARIGGAINFILEFFFPILAIMFCYIEIVRAVHRRKIMHGNSSGSQMSKASVCILKLLVFNSAAFLVCIGPRDLYIIPFYVSLWPVNLTSNLYYFLLILSASICWINPLIFMIKFEEFHRGVRSLTAVCRRKRAGVVAPLSQRISVATITQAAAAATASL
jgi:7 transmembrane receptor (rhodopsin family)